MDELDQPCQVKHGEGWRPGRGRYREEGPRQINAQSQKKAHTDTKSSVLENLKVAHPFFVHNDQSVCGRGPPSF